MIGKSVIIIACCIAATLAVPLQSDHELIRERKQLQPPQPQLPTPKFNFQPPPPNPNDKRFEITRFDGGGSRSQGFDVNAAGRAKIWESSNGLNQVHGSGSYSQHLGGPWGNSRPNVGGGISFTRRF